MIIIAENERENELARRLAQECSGTVYERQDAFAVTLWSVRDVLQEHPELTEATATDFLESYERRLRENSIAGGWDFIENADYSEFTNIPGEHATLENATFVSVWDGGYRIETPCKVNRQTGEVTDIEFSEGTADFVNELDEEFILLEDGSEYPVEQGEDSGGYWYMPDEEIEEVVGGTGDRESVASNLDSRISAAEEQAAQARECGAREPIDPER